MTLFPSTPRRLRDASGVYAYHVLNRAVGRAGIFGKQRDYEAFEEGVAGGERAGSDARVCLVRDAQSLASGFGRAKYWASESRRGRETRGEPEYCRTVWITQGEGGWRMFRLRI